MTDIEDAVAFVAPRGADGTPVIAAIERSTDADFGLFADLEAADVSLPSYGISQQNSPVTVSTDSRCLTFLKLSLPDKGADQMTIHGSPTGGSDRSGDSGNIDFDLSAMNAAAVVSVTLDPGESGSHQDCKEEFRVGQTAETLEPLNDVEFQLIPGKNAHFRFSRQPGGKNPSRENKVRLASSFTASEIRIHRKDGVMWSQYSGVNPGGISVDEITIHPASIEYTLTGEALWLDAAGPHWREWAFRHPGRLLVYISLDLTLFAAIVFLWKQRAVPYVFISYAHEDRSCAEHIVQRLRTARIHVWYDDDLRMGEDWKAKLQNVIEDCCAFVVLLSPESTKSSFVSQEALLARKRGKLLLPILLRDTENPIFMDLQYLDARAKDPLPELLKRLQALSYAHGALKSYISMPAE